MSENERVQFRAPPDLTDAVERIAERDDLSKSAAWRSVALEGLTHLTDGDLSHVAAKQQLEQIKEEEHLRQRAAWFRANVSSLLLKAWNGGLTPEEADDYLNGYRREAEELHEDSDLVDYLETGLRVYAGAHPDNGAKLSTWIKSRENADVPDGTPAVDTEPVADTVEQDATADATADPDHPELTVEDAAREFHEWGFAAENITAEKVQSVDGTKYEVRDRLRELQDLDQDQEGAE